MVLSGLPMYTEVLTNAGYSALSSLATLREPDLVRCGIQDPLHRSIILSAIASTWSQDTPPTDPQTNGQTDRNVSGAHV